MNHFNISIIKSGLRILGGLISVILIIVSFALDLNVLYIASSVISLGIFFTLAEFLGILEEIYDKRKED